MHFKKHWNNVTVTMSLSSSLAIANWLCVPSASQKTVYLMERRYFLPINVILTFKKYGASRMKRSATCSQTKESKNSFKSSARAETSNNLCIDLQKGPQQKTCKNQSSVKWINRVVVHMHSASEKVNPTSKNQLMTRSYYYMLVSPVVHDISGPLPVFWTPVLKSFKESFQTLVLCTSAMGASHSTWFTDQWWRFHYFRSQKEAHRPHSNRAGLI